VIRYPGLPAPRRVLRPETKEEREDREMLRLLAEVPAALSGAGFALAFSGVAPGAINAGLGAGLAAVVIWIAHQWLTVACRQDAAEMRERADG
jgi:hypothetical protein